MQKKLLEGIDLHIESLIFASEKPINIDDLRFALENFFNTVFEKEQISESIQRIKNKYDSEDFSFKLTEISEAFTFITKTEYHGIISSYLKYISRTKLSKASLETLAIVAYNQPVTKPSIEHLRGVNSDFSIQKLLEKDLIEIAGRDDSPGKPLIYKTSVKFLDYFGLRTIKDLPSIKEFVSQENSVGFSEEE